MSLADLPVLFPDVDPDCRRMSAALQYLQRELTVFAAGGRRPTPVANGGCLGFWRRPRPVPPVPPASDGRWPALDAFGDAFALGGFERDVLLLCTAFELQPAVAELCRQAQPGVRPYPTFDLAVRFFEWLRGPEAVERCWGVLSPDAPLTAWGLVRPEGSGPLTGLALRLGGRALSFLTGVDLAAGRPVLAPEIVGQIDPLSPRQPRLSARQRRTGERLTAALRRLGSRPVIQLIGPNGEAKELTARWALSRFNAELADAYDVGGTVLPPGRQVVRAFRTDPERLPTGQADLRAIVRLWAREQRLYPFLYLYLDAHNADLDGDRGRAIDVALLELSQTPLVVAVREPRPIPGRRVILLDVNKPSALEQKRAWSRGLGVDRSEVGRLVSEFHFNLPALRRIARQARGDGKASAAVVVDRAARAARATGRPSLDKLAERLRTRGSFADLVLPPEQLAHLGVIAGQVANLSQVYDEWGVGRAGSRGLGVAVLFAGDSGTGKTFAAEVLAHEVKLDLYRIDLSAVVDKYVGETEKKLRAVFDAAEDAGAVLLFDEADALFGKRTEVRDSHDRFANIQINYLLQRVESFRGLAVLATNKLDAIDPAFLRRLRFVIPFDFPRREYRRLIWQKLLPTPSKDDEAKGRRVPVRLSDGDYERLAAFQLSGGNIRTAALNAAFIAAARPPKERVVVYDDAARAAGWEVRKAQEGV